MAKRSTKVINVLNDEIIANEEYYLNNPNLPKAESTYTYTPEMYAEIVKCTKDIVYFAEHFFYINGMNGKEIIKLFAKQKKILRTIQKSKKTCLVTSRQWGKSTLMTIVAVWTALFFPDQTIAIVANKQSTATEIFNRVRLAFLQMDNWLKGGVVEFNKTFFTLANGSRIITSATSPDAIRGLSIDVLLLDEFAIIPPKLADDFWAAVTPTLATRFNNNKNAKLIVASTPKGIGNKFHDLVSKAEQDKNDFKVEKAFWYDFPGRDEAWKEQEVSTMGLQLFLQEYECVFLNNSGSPFDPEMFDKFELEMIEPINTLDDGNYLIWKKPNEKAIYAMGVDTSEGTGQDYSVMQIFDITDPVNIEQVARYSTNKMDTNTWASKVRDVARQWHNPIMLVERNGPGGTPCDRLFYDWNYTRMVNFGARNPESPCKSIIHIRPGIISHTANRALAVNNMKYYVHDRRCVKLYDKVTIDELKVFVRTKTPGGFYKWAAQMGYHDDHVMAMTWALFAIHHSVINEYLHVDEKNGDEIPIKISRKWEFNPDTDYDDSFYKQLDTDSPLVGVMLMQNKGTIHHVKVQADIQKFKAKPGTLEYLLDHAPMEQYTGYTPNFHPHKYY